MSYKQAEKASNLMHKDANFNKANVLAFTTDKFRNYKEVQGMHPQGKR